MEQRSLKNVSNCMTTNIYSYLETPGGQNYNLYLNVAHFFMAGVNCQLDISGSLRQMFSCIGA